MAPTNPAALVAFLLLGLASCSPVRSSVPYDEAEAEAQIRTIEEKWAQVAVTGDPSIIDSIFADDFVGTDPDGALYSKADFIADTKAHPLGFVSIGLNAMKVRFFGEVALAQGSETFTRKGGEVGRFVWTDVLVRRGGRWVIIAAQDVVAAAAAKSPGTALFDRGAAADSQK